MLRFAEQEAQRNLGVSYAFGSGRLKDYDYAGETRHRDEPMRRILSRVPRSANWSYSANCVPTFSSTLTRGCTAILNAEQSNHPCLK